MNAAKTEHLIAVKTSLAEKYAHLSTISNSAAKRKQLNFRSRAHARKAAALREALEFHRSANA